MKQPRKFRRPAVPALKGKAAGVEAYQRPLDTSAQADAEEGIRQGLEDIREGKVQPARQFFDEFEAPSAYVVKVTAGRNTTLRSSSNAVHIRCGARRNLRRSEIR